MKKIKVLSGKVHKTMEGTFVMGTNNDASSPGLIYSYSERLDRSNILVDWKWEVRSGGSNWIEDEILFDQRRRMMSWTFHPRTVPSSENE